MEHKVVSPYSIRCMKQIYNALVNNKFLFFLKLATMLYTQKTGQALPVPPRLIQKSTTASFQQSFFPEFFG
jgi:hypothetical protein